MALDVYRIPPPLETGASSEPPQCEKVATFQFPPFTRNVCSAEIHYRSEPNPTHAGTMRPFHPDPDKRIFTISLHILVRVRNLIGGVDNVYKNFTIFVHSDVFFKFIDPSTLAAGQSSRLRPETFLWNQWSSFARWTTIKNPPGFSRFDPVEWGRSLIDDTRSTTHVWTPICRVRRESRFPRLGLQSIRII